MIHKTVISGQTFILSRVRVTLVGVLDRILDLLITLTHDRDYTLQITNTRRLVSSVYNGLH
jgi:hypothetical protein